MWADTPLAHYQIVDLEDIVMLLKYRLLTDGMQIQFPHLWTDISGR